MILKHKKGLTLLLDLNEKNLYCLPTEIKILIIALTKLGKASLLAKLKVISKNILRYN